MRGTAWPLALSLLASLGAPGCSGSSMPPANTEGGAGGADAGPGAAGSSGGAGAGAGGDAGTASYAADCPATLPANASACATEGRVCSYGSAPRAECRDRTICTGGRWAGGPGTCKAPSPAAECPATAPAAQAACTKDQQLCAYPDGKECVCFDGNISNLGWLCDVPRNTGGACPDTVPNAGTACTGSTSCTYVCGLLTASSVLARCVDGAWTWGFMACGNNN